MCFKPRYDICLIGLAGLLGLLAQGVHAAWLDIRTTPGGAQVFVNQKDAGRTGLGKEGLLTLELPAGNHEIEVRWQQQSQIVRSSQRIELHEGQPQKLQFTLTQEAASKENGQRKLLPVLRNF